MEQVGCPVCGATNQASGAPCTACGAAIPPQPDPTTPPRIPPSKAPTTATPRHERSTATGPRVITVGRAPDNTVVLDHPIVSGHHARITVEGDGAVIEDLGSSNGLAIGEPGARVTRAPLAESDVVYFGTLPVPASRLLGGPLRRRGATQVIPALTKPVIVLGRDPACDHVLPHPEISRRHARIFRTATGLAIEDLGSTNGTYVNRERLTRAVPLNADDEIALGSFTFRVAADGSIVEHAWRHDVTVEARGICVDIPGARLIENVSLTVFPSELVGVMGPSGAGKTTLLSALNGYVAPAAGQVLYNGQDLYSSYDLFRLQLGYVPQDDIMHRDLTVRDALYYTARLRLPSDTTDAEIRERIARVLEQLGLHGIEDTRIGTPERRGISGGERKRVNVAMELVTDPSVLFLDEPTSGLSSEDALTVVKVLRALADSGKTVIVTIHQPSREVFELFNQIVVVGRDQESGATGRLVYYGPAFPDAISFFNPESGSDTGSARSLSPDLLLRGMASAPTSEWVKKYESSELKRHYVEQRAGSGSGTAPARAQARPQRRFGLSQWWTLVRRCTAVKLGDRDNFVMLLIQAPAIALFTTMVFGPHAQQAMTHANWLRVAGSVGGALFMLVVTSPWLGCSNSAREIVAEWAIYRRERMVNLKIPSYLLSKVVVLGAISVLQCFVLVGGIFLGCGCNARLWPALGITVLLALVGLACGLIISAFASTSEVAISMVPTVLLPMIMFGGIFVPLADMGRPAAAVAQAMPSRWAFEGLILLETTERPQWEAPSPPGTPRNQVVRTEFADRYFAREVRTSIEVDAAVLAGMLVFLLAGIMVILRARDVL